MLTSMHDVFIINLVPDFIFYDAKSTVFLIPSAPTQRRTHVRV